MADWQLLQTRNKGQLSGQEMAAFNNTPCVYATHDAMTMHNLQELAVLQVPFTKTIAKHDGGAEASTIRKCRRARGICNPRERSLSDDIPQQMAGAGFCQCNN